MKWFKVFGQDFLNDEKIRGLSQADRGLWLDLMCIASIQEPPGVISTATLLNVYRYNSRTLTKIRETFIKLLGMFQEVSGNFEVVNWAKYQSDYNLYQMRKKKTSKALRKKLVKDEDIEVEVDKEVEVEVDKEKDKGKYNKKKPDHYILADIFCRKSAGMGKLRVRAALKAFLEDNKSFDQIKTEIENMPANAPVWELFKGGSNARSKTDSKRGRGGIASFGGQDGKFDGPAGEGEVIEL